MRTCAWVGVQHERARAFSHSGDFSGLISANSAASPSVLGGVHTQVGLLGVPGGGLGVLAQRGGGDPAVNQCYLAGVSQVCVRLSEWVLGFTDYRINLAFSAAASILAASLPQLWLHA